MNEKFCSLSRLGFKTMVNYFEKEVKRSVRLSGQTWIQNHGQLFRKGAQKKCTQNSSTPKSVSKWNELCTDLNWEKIFSKLILTRFVTLCGKIPPIPTPRCCCVPSDIVSHNATVSIFPLCCTWFGGREYTRYIKIQ